LKGSGTTQSQLGLSRLRCQHETAPLDAMSRWHRNRRCDLRFIARCLSYCVTEGFGRLDVSLSKQGKDAGFDPRLYLVVFLVMRKQMSSAEQPHTTLWRKPGQSVLWQNPLFVR
jgi:hypothetical protein